MSPAKEGYPDTSSDTNAPVTRSQSPMSSTIINTAPHGYGRLEAMPGPYNDRAPGHPHQRPIEIHPLDSSHQQGPRLPPLVAGPPSTIASSHTHYLPQPSGPPPSYSGKYSSTANTAALPSAGPPSSAYSNTTSHQQQQQHQHQHQGEGHFTQSERAHQSPLAASADNLEARRPFQSQKRPLAQPQNHILRPRQRHLEPNIPPVPALAMSQSASMSSSTQNQRAESGPGTIMIPNLLGPNRAQALGDIRFRLVMRQQPQAARACGFGDRDRRVVDPPPIVQLIVESPSLTRDEIQLYLRYESYVMNCSICDESGTRDASYMPEEYQHQRRLMGSLVGTPFVGQDENGYEGCFFCFSDLSCRTPGAFRLKFTLIMIDPSRAGIVKHFPILTETQSGVFHVYSAKEFPGMMPSSDLAKRLKEQGCIISIKKGNERARNARAQDEASDNNDEEFGTGSQTQQARHAAHT